MKKVYYLDFYYKNGPDVPARTCSLAGVNKADYVSRVLADEGFDVELVSPCLASGGEGLPGSFTKLGERLHLKLFASLKAKTKPARAMRRLYVLSALFFYLLFHVDRDSTLLVYHSLFYCGVVRWIKRLKRCALVLEVEEVYSDVTGDAQKKEQELRFFHCADAYLFSSSPLADAINTEKKPQIISCGIYRCEDVFEQPASDGATHCVYAGTLDPRKGGCIAAVAAAQHLPAQYRMHILGTGSEKELRDLNERIAQVNAGSACRVTYDGLRTGEDFNRFLQTCHVGLATQNPDAAFNATSFPSKILTYLCNGLQVVSPRIAAVERSPVSQEICYYEAQTPETIAAAIVRAATRTGKSRAVIEQLDRQFRKELAALLS